MDRKQSDGEAIMIVALEICAVIVLALWLIGRETLSEEATADLMGKLGLNLMLLVVYGVILLICLLCLAVALSA